jgi:flagellar basal-body rod protein FlgB
MIDPIFQSDSMQLAGKFLDAAALRQNAIASNIANAETPGYHRVDVAPDFATQLKASWETGQFSGEANDIQPTLAEDADARSVQADGNNVDVEKELLAMDHNSVDYEYLSDVVTYNIKQLKMAITGSGGS